MEGLAGVSESLRLLVTVSRASLHTPPDQFELVSPPPRGGQVLDRCRDGTGHLLNMPTHQGVNGCRILPPNDSLPLPRCMLLVGHIWVVEVPVTRGTA